MLAGRVARVVLLCKKFVIWRCVVGDPKRSVALKTCERNWPSEKPKDLMVRKIRSTASSDLL